jgi:hypothetical protein
MPGCSFGDINETTGWLVGSGRSNHQNHAPAPLHRLVATREGITKETGRACVVCDGWVRVDGAGGDGSSEAHRCWRMEPRALRALQASTAGCGLGAHRPIHEAGFSTSSYGSAGGGFALPCGADRNLAFARNRREQTRRNVTPCPSQGYHQGSQVVDKPHQDLEVA